MRERRRVHEETVLHIYWDIVRGDGLGNLKARAAAQEIYQTGYGSWDDRHHVDRCVELASDMIKCGLRRYWGHLSQEA